MRRILAAAILLVGLSLPLRASAGDGCHPIPVTWYSPTGIAGCVVYGDGTASGWGGPSVARNDCVFPWTHCQTIAIQSLQTGIVIIVTPRMFGDLYTGTSQQRIVDLDPASVRALGLDPAAGLWPVKVWPVSPSTGFAMPDTATKP